MMEGPLPMRLAAVSLLMLPLIAGCTFTTGIVPVGPDTYKVSEMRSPARGGGAQAERALLAETDAFCRRQNKVFLAIDLRPDGDPYTPYYPTAFDATFRCVPAAHE
jgi:hypothetical protein